MASCETCDNCQGCNTCEGCNSCQGCNRCLGCNICQKCDTCQKGETNHPCWSAQNFCLILTDTLSSLCKDIFSFNPCPETNKTIMGPKNGQFNKASWDAICQWIDQRKKQGIVKPGGSAFSNSTKSSVAPFSAEEFNRIARELGANTVTAGTRIEGHYFKALESAAKDYKIDGLACKTCNTKCNTNCDACVKCNSCESLCDFCNKSCNTNNSSCYDRDPSKQCDDEKA